MKQSSIISGWTGLFFAFTALFFYSVASQETMLIWASGATALICIVYFLIAEARILKSAFKTRSALYGMNSMLLVVILLGILVFINLIASRHKYRFDLTSEGIFTLAPQTQKIVSNLPRDVKITAFFQADSPGKVNFKNLIDGYLELTDKIDLSFVDPDQNPSIIKRYGVTTYGTVALESGKQETKIKDPSEENLTNALLKVIKDEKKTIYFLEGHGEKNPENAKGDGYSTAKAALEKDSYIVEKLLLLKTGEIPEKAELLVISGPEKPVLPEEQKIIEAYLERGGSVLLMIDPNSTSDMEALLGKWGIRLQDDIIIDPTSKLFGGDYAAPIVSQYTLHDITKDFTLATIFPLLRSVKLNPVDGTDAQQLLQTGVDSWAETNFNSQKVKFDEGVDTKGPVPIAVIATREIGVATEKDEQPVGGDEPAVPEEPNNKKTALRAKLMVIGDSDFASNSYFNFSGNSDFFLNSVSWMVEEANLISIRSRERKNQPFQLTTAWGSTLFILGMVVFPGCVIIAGLRTWWRRRRL